MDHNIYHVFHQAAGGVLHVRESLQDCASRAWDAEGEEGHSLSKVPPRTGRAGGLHGIKKLAFTINWAFTIPGETCQSSCTNAEADNKCHQDGGVRLKNGPYSASNELVCKLWFVKNTICQLSRLFAIWLLMFPGNSLDLFVFVSIFNCDQKSDDLSYQVWKHVKWTDDIADSVYLLELNLNPYWNDFFIYFIKVATWSPFANFLGQVIVSSRVDILAPFLLRTSVFSRLSWPE